MPHYFKKEAVSRIIDANLNRAKEGLRVCEEITRFVLNSPRLTQGLKCARHEISRLSGRIPFAKILIQSRDSSGDVGRHILANEFKRRGLSDIFFANIQRVKESIRVLEEFTKLTSKDLAADFKELRYKMYKLEKETAKRLSS